MAADDRRVQYRPRCWSSWRPGPGQARPAPVAAEGPVPAAVPTLANREQALAALLQSDGPWAEAIIRHQATVQAARHLGDRLGQANALHDLGDVRRLTGQYSAAVQVLERALDIYRDIGNRNGEVEALGTPRPSVLADGFRAARFGQCRRRVLS